MLYFNLFSCFFLCEALWARNETAPYKNGMYCYHYFYRCSATYGSSGKVFASVLGRDVGDHCFTLVANVEPGRVDAVTIVNNALSAVHLSLALEPHRHREFVHFVFGEPRTKE